MCLIAVEWAASSDSCAVERSYKYLNCVCHGSQFVSPHTGSLVAKDGFIVAAKLGADFVRYGRLQCRLGGEVVHAYADEWGYRRTPSYSLGVVAWSSIDNEIGSLAMYVPAADGTSRSAERIAFFDSLLKSPVKGRMKRLLASKLIPARVRRAVACHLEYEW